MPDARAVRIPRAAPDRSGPGDPERPAPDLGEPRPNRAGSERGRRTFLLFLAAVAVTYGTFLALLATSPSTGVRGDPAAYGSLTAAAAVLALAGFALTLARAPRSVLASPEGVRVTERSGRVRTFLFGPQYSVAVLERYPAGFLSDGPVELLRISAGPGAGRTYLVAEGVVARGPVGDPTREGPRALPPRA